MGAAARMTARPPPGRGAWSTAWSGAASRRRPGGWSSGPRRWPPGAGRSTRCPATSAATCTRRRWTPARWCCCPTFRLPTQIHTRSANAKWLDELAHTNPVWIHPSDAARFGVGPHRRPGPGRDRDRLLRRQGVDHRGHPARASSRAATTWAAGGCTAQPARRGRHDGHRRPAPRGRRLADGAPRAFGPIESADPDSQRIWWTDTGVHQNLTFPVHPDPISGMHCWHQAVRVRPAAPGDRARRHRRRHRQGPRGLPGVAGPDPPGRPGLARRDPPPALADAPAQAGRRGVRPARADRDPADGRIDDAGRAELLRALGAVAGVPPRPAPRWARPGPAGP